VFCFIFEGKIVTFLPYFYLSRWHGCPVATLQIAVRKGKTDAKCFLKYAELCCNISDQ